ncbi:MAG: aminotransferase class III-fold pyridoxal phosphate-dependent enzyme, partial [Cyanobacteria bacterium HKST-UBA04]|nr:aminotransferase class III-fold pyridoxal phosphate-dependent enzyme [Cyanobacteria bacterium HKST-UBA04]
AIADQAAKYLHMSGTDFYYNPMVDLARRLDETSPGSTPKKVFFGNSGAEAIEGALKLARHYTKRQTIISFYRSFHGRTYGAMSVCASKAIHRRHFSPMMASVQHGHYPYPLRPFFGHRNPEDEAAACLEFINDHLFKMLVKPDEVAGIIVEPIQGEGGYVVPPANWLPGLRQLCDEHGIMLIADEVQAGVGRTGEMWACQHDGIEPDIIASAKGLASGMPLSAIIAKAEIMNWEPGTHATTFGGNPVCCAAAIETIDLIEGGLKQQAARMGQVLMSGLQGLVDKYDCLAEVRGRGLMVGLEVVKPGTAGTKGADYPGDKDGDGRNWLVDQCFEHGLLLLGCGENTIRFSPPLVVSEAQVHKAVEILETVVRQYKGG